MPVSQKKMALAKYIQCLLVSSPPCFRLEIYEILFSMLAKEPALS